MILELTQDEALEVEQLLLDVVYGEYSTTPVGMLSIDRSRLMDVLHKVEEGKQKSTEVLP